MRTPTEGFSINRLTFVRMLPPLGAGKHRMGYWRCVCGSVREYKNSRVMNGYTKSCGCLLADSNSATKSIHGMRYSAEYQSWQAMKDRCLNPLSSDYPRYGASGITICDEWMDFRNFYADMGKRPVGTTIDRIDGKRGYSKDNCRWASPTQQNRNKGNFTWINTPNGVMPLVDYASQIGLSRGAAHLRLKRGKLEGCSRVR